MYSAAAFACPSSSLSPSSSSEITFGSVSFQHSLNAEHDAEFSGSFWPKRKKGLSPVWNKCLGRYSALPKGQPRGGFVYNAVSVDIEDCLSRSIWKWQDAKPRTTWSRPWSSQKSAERPTQTLPSMQSSCCVSIDPRTDPADRVRFIQFASTCLRIWMSVCLHV